MRALNDVPPISAVLASLTAALCILVNCSSAGQQSQAPSEGPAERTAIPSDPSVERPPTEEAGEILPGYAKLREKWTGDLDGMVERGYIRALVVPSKTSYFLDGAQQRGITYEAMREFERFVNEKLGRPKRTIHVVFIPVRRDELIPSVADGTGDIAAANLSVTPDRQKRVDFSDAGVRNVKEL